MCCICHNLFLYFSLKVSICPERGTFTVRAQFKSKSPDECCEEHFKCQQTMFLITRRNAAYCQLNLCKSFWKCSTGRLRMVYMTTFKTRSSCFSCARWRNFSCSYWDRVQSYLCPLCEAFISPNRCRLEWLWPLLLVVRKHQSWEAESQTPW